MRRERLTTLVGMLVLAGVTIAACRPSGYDCDCDYAGGPEQLFERADAIVIARAVEQREVRVDRFAPDGRRTGYTTERTMLFAVEESLRSTPGRETGPTFEASLNGIGDIVIGGSYLLPLRSPDVQVFDGRPYWSAHSIPAYAAIDGDALTFMPITDGYRRSIAETGVEPGLTGAGPAFDITLTEARMLIAKSAPPP